MVVCCFSGQKRHGAAGEAKDTTALPISVASSSTGSVVIRNFNSMYEYDDQYPSADSETQLSDDDDSEASLSVAMASRRLTRPDTTGNSNSIFNSATDPVLTLTSVRVGAEPRCSPDPHEEFRSSMAEMVTALGLVGEGHQNDHLELQQLLLCYLALNRKDAHKYIVRAFADLLRGLPPAAPDR